MEIKELLKETRKKIKYCPPQTLFSPVWESLKYSRCPLCNSKLKYMARSDKLMICNSTKHRKSFIVTIEKLRTFKN